MTDFDEPLKIAKVCAVCGRVLSYWSERGWFHAAPELLADDHPAVPVDHTDVPFIGRCDFCQADRPGFVIPCKPFALNVLPGHGSSADWAACDTCARLVDTNQWSAVLRRARIAYQHVSGAPMLHDVEATVRLLYAQVRRNVTGPSRPL